MTDRDFAWLTDHGVEIYQKYAGKWIAVRDEQIIAVGDTATEAVAKATQIAPDGEFILEGVDFESDVIYEHS